VFFLPRTNPLFGAHCFRIKQNITVDPEKIEVIRGCPAPTNVSEVISFMGLVGYHRIFIKDSLIFLILSLLYKIM
jgi:hypothetical protein